MSRHPIGRRAAAVLAAAGAGAIAAPLAFPSGSGATVDARHSTGRSATTTLAVADPASGAGGSTPAGPPACAPAVASWTTGQLANQLLIVLGKFATLGTTAPEAASGVGALDFLGQPAAGSGPSIAAGLAGLRADAAGAGEVTPWLGTTEEGGTVTRLAAVIGAMPSARQMATGSTATIQSTAQHQAAAMAGLGFTLDLAPVLDTAPPSDTVAAEGTRSFSDTGHAAGADGLAFARGMQAGGVVPVVKHFPGLGHANGNTDTGPATDPPLATLEKNDLIPFEEAASAGLPAVMVGNMKVPGLTNGKPASLSPAAYALLRHTLGFTGVTMTDSLSAGAISSAGYDQASAAAAALEAGSDLAMVTAATWRPAEAAVAQAISSGALPVSTARADAGRILAAKGIATCPTVGMATASGTGYWVAGSGGGISAFGSATTAGSMAGRHLDQPVVGMAATPSHRGYWEAASDGGIFSFGDAAFHGSMGGKPLNQPIVGMAATPTGGGYWEVASDGGIFAFGNAQFAGSAAGTVAGPGTVALLPARTGQGYMDVTGAGRVTSYGDAPDLGDMSTAVPGYGGHVLGGATVPG